MIIKQIKRFIFYTIIAFISINLLTHLGLLTITPVLLIQTTLVIGLIATQPFIGQAVAAGSGIFVKHLKETWSGITVVGRLEV